MAIKLDHFLQKSIDQLYNYVKTLSCYYTAKILCW